ncbi:type III secretion protein [Yersinia enterocolitica]|uniref:Type III secretion protein n=1 Tax=Yersinia enterocolitica serotype O:8 / biotype 1B (strain NCTC 13174 / 8081) TaxID=393305 RepID=A1JQ95_YERE8|nr:type III secretion protein [Yersinia enterocolitica]AJJ22908.1 putative type III secretion protein [Yersinia enterocolitica]CAL13566.1 type III secretion protein [Yersinia enterocolitica subsp. enterocolitica 8081]CRY24645.1 type III secretion protein [Yersinia enterocolitica]HDL8281314.1 type III secretion protein [Yersinia enterocolitica]HDM8291187.1 type III secretion protein [Yersinia enterocolitica]
MVAIKQVAHSAPPDIRKEEPANVSRPVTRNTDNGQAVKSFQQEVQKKMTELLAKAKQRKKQAEEQLAPALAPLMMPINSMPLSKQLALPNMAQGHETAEQPQAMEKVGAKPTPVVDKVSGGVTVETLLKPTATLTQLNVIPRDNGEQPLPGLIAVTSDNSEMPMVAVPSAKREGNKDEMSDTSVSQDRSDSSGSTVKQPIAASFESLREATSSVPLAESQENTLGDEQTHLLTTQQLAGQPLATQPPAVTQPEEMKTPSKAEMTALPEPVATESEPTAGRRTLSYTFTQWTNSPMVKFELSKAGELTAMTDSAEVQLALQNNHHLLESENPLDFRDERHDEERRGQQQSEQEDEK